MSNLRSFENIKILLFLTVIIVFALLIRFNNFNNRVNFGPEQAISLITSGDYIKNKFSLLGIKNLQRVTSQGHVVFSGALFTYSLVPLQLIFNFAPLPISAYFALLNIATGLALFFVALKIFNSKVAVFSAVIFLFNDYMINHSLFIWIVNYLPILSVAIIYLLYKQKKEDKLRFAFLTGLLVGISFGLEYFYLFTAFLVFVILMWVSKKRISSALFFIIGTMLGNLPMLIFDIKHDFYHIKVLWQYFLDTLNNPGQSLISYYHFLQFWPLLALIGGLAFSLIYKKSRYLAIILLVLYINLNLSSTKISFKEAIGMSKGLNYPKVEAVAEAIANDKPIEFNIATLLDFDSRAYPLRYLIQYRYNLQPLGVEDYPKAKVIYVLANYDYNFNLSKTWEIDSFRPFKVTTLTSIDKQYSVFKLVKF